MKINEKNFIYYLNNFFILNAEIYKSFSIFFRKIELFNNSIKFEYFIGDNKVFIKIDKNYQKII